MNLCNQLRRNSDLRYRLGPCLFVISSLVPEDYGVSRDDEELPSSFLIGSLASSIYRFTDTNGVEGGFFIFNDLGISQPGRFRLRFTLYERDQYSSQYVSELITNTFSVVLPDEFPGHPGPTPLSLEFINQGVKLRCRRPKKQLQDDVGSRLFSCEQQRLQPALPIKRSKRNG